MTQSPHSLPRKVAALILTPEELQAAEQALSQLDWGEEGLTRDEIRERYPDLPSALYLRLPSSKHFTSAEDALHNVADARSRADGEIPDEDTDIPVAESIGDGGPPGYGPDPLYSNRGKEDGGSAEDTEGLFLPEEDTEQ